LVDVGCGITLGPAGSHHLTYADRADLYRLNINSVHTVEREPLPVFFPDGLHVDTNGEIVLIDGGGAVVWKRNSGLEVVASHTHDITALASMNQGTGYIFAACAGYGYYGDGEHFCSGAEMAMKDWQRPAKQIRGHSAPVRQIVVNQAQTLFASVSDDGTIIVWGAWLEPKPLQRYGGIHRLG
jgi:hypothetical protein